MFRSDTRKLAYFSQSIGGLSGAGQSAFDVLRVLLDFDFKVIVCSGRSATQWPELDPRSSSGLRWVRTTAEISSKSGQPLRRLAKNRLLHLFNKAWSRLEFAGLRHILVDSLGSHEIFASYKPSRQIESTVIIRESPQFFTAEYSPTNLSWALNALSSYKSYIFVSNICKKKWLDHGLDAEKKSYFIPNCCREDIVGEIRSRPRAQLRQKLQISDEHFVLVCIASIQPRKGQDLIVEACKQLQKKIPTIVIYLIGPIITQWGRQLKRKVERSGLGNRIKFFGRRSNALEYIYAADALVLPSHAEALPRTVLEAMAIETPIVASDVDGVRELIEHGKSGLLFQKGDINGLIAGVARIFEAPADGDNFRRAARIKYWSNFSRQHQVGRFEQVLKELLDQP